MKKIILFALSCIALSNAWSQTDSIRAPYLKVPVYPPVKLLMADSASYFTKDMLPKKKPVMLVVFNPECDHCQHETEEILKNIDQFKDVQIVMATTAELRMMRAFIERYDLGKYDNIVVGYDPNLFLITFFQMHNLPFLAFYNKNKDLISVFEGSMPIDKVVAELKK